MRKGVLVLAATAAAALAVVAGFMSNREARGSNPGASISIQDMHRQVDTASIPVTVVEDPF